MNRMRTIRNILMMILSNEENVLSAILCLATIASFAQNGDRPDYLLAAKTRRWAGTHGIASRLS